MPKLIVPTVYIDKLKAIDEYDAWLAGIKLRWNHSDCLLNPVYGGPVNFRLRGDTSFCSFIIGSFNWPAVPSSHTEWATIAQMPIT